MLQPMETTYQHTSRSIPVEVCNKAINALFPFLGFDSQKRKELINFISAEFAALDCCVLYRISKRFKELCDRLGLDPENQEVIIRENLSVFYSNNFNISPINIRSIKSL